MNLSSFPAWLLRHKLKASLFVSVSLAVYLGIFLMQPPAVADLSTGNRHYASTLVEKWGSGEIIVLFRHLERCDKGYAPCLEGTKGITARSVEEGLELREDFYQLGMANTDVHNSPLDRTAQSEAIIFDDVGIDQDWLWQCPDDVLQQALDTKQPGRNLVLVTHSSCIKRFKAALGYEDERPKYGTSVFFAENPEGPLQVLGFLDAEDWEPTLGF